MWVHHVHSPCSHASLLANCKSFKTGAAVYRSPWHGWSYGPGEIPHSPHPDSGHEDTATG